MAFEYKNYAFLDKENSDRSITLILHLSNLHSGNRAIMHFKADDQQMKIKL